MQTSRLHPIPEARPSLQCPESSLGLGHIWPPWLTFSLSPCWRSSLQVPQIGTDRTCPKGSIVNHTAGLSSDQSLQPTRTLLLGRTLQGPGDHLPEAEGQDRTSLGKVNSSQARINTAPSL